MNRQIVEHSKNVNVFDPLLTGHVFWRMCSGRVRIFNGNQRETLRLITQERIDIWSEILHSDKIISAIWRRFLLISAYHMLNVRHISTFGWFDLLT